MKKVITAVFALVMCAVVFAGCSSDKSYSDLSMIKDVEIGVEEYAIAFRSGSDMVEKVDAATANLFEDGTMARIAAKYDLTDSLVGEFKASEDANASGDSDWEYIKNKGTMVVGITVFDPMNYHDANGDWTGFDTEYARAIGEELGISVEFKVIVWDSKEMELDTKSIDCIWNGMTVTDAIVNAADVTGAYIKNYQVVVVKDADTYTSLKALDGKTVVAESGSAGEAAAKADEYLSKNYKAVESQSDALLQVKSGAADACVIDYIMAKSMLGK